MVLRVRNDRRVVDATEDLLSQGKSCFQDCQWLEAHRLLLQADAETGLSAPDLELLAEATYLIGDEDEALEHFERAHRSHLDAGEILRAARCGFWLGMHSLFRGDLGRARGWFGRVGRLIEDRPDAVEQGYLMLPGVEMKMAEGDFDAAITIAADARELGARCGDGELAAIATHLEGRASILAGRVRRGLALLDEAMVSVLGGELSTRVAGLLYCSVIAACQQVSAVDRAAEWTEALTGFCERQPAMESFTGKCLIHRAEILQLHGNWHDAIAEARLACERFERGRERGQPGAAYYQQGEVHRLCGELEAAEAAYLRAGEAGADPQPGLALLRLAQGKGEAAKAAMARALAATDAPLARARMLPAQVEILLATGNADTARTACDELCEIALRFDTEVIVAAAEQARGAVELAAGDARNALRPLGSALTRWEQAEVPYQVARTRVLLSRACGALGDRDGEELQRRAARVAFEQLGAAPDLAALSDATAAVPVASHSLSRRELEVLKLVATGKTNRSIAETLSLSVRTVDRHVSNIFTKLDVSSRAAATAYAYEHGLV